MTKMCDNNIPENIAADINNDFFEESFENVNSFVQNGCEHPKFFNKRCRRRKDKCGETCDEACDENPCEFPYPWNPAFQPGCFNPGFINPGFVNPGLFPSPNFPLYPGCQPLPCPCSPEEAAKWQRKIQKQIYREQQRLFAFNQQWANGCGFPCGFPGFPPGAPYMPFFDGGDESEKCKRNKKCRVKKTNYQIKKEKQL
jgi:hypothetical protein